MIVHARKPKRRMKTQARTSTPIAAIVTAKAAYPRPCARGLSPDKTRFGPMSGIHRIPGGASLLFQRGKSLQPNTGGLLNGRAIGNCDRLNLDRHPLNRAGK